MKRKRTKRTEIFFIFGYGSHIHTTTELSLVNEWMVRVASEHAQS